MDFFSHSPYTLRHMPRRHAGPTRPSIVCLTTKTPAHWIHGRFDNCIAYSFVLEGDGTLSIDNAPPRPVAGPCCFIEQPGHRYDYGPHRQWIELFFIYDLEQQAALAAAGLYQRERHHWLIHDKAAFYRRMHDLSAALERLMDPGAVDRVDRLSELLIIESLQSPEQQPSDPETERIHIIRDELLKEYSDDVDYDEIALKHGFSPAGFRRAWRRHFIDPPARFVMKHRIDHACRLLAQTDMPVHGIATELHFADALYFSRKFSREVGMPPSVYRSFARAPFAHAPSATGTPTGNQPQ